MRKIDWMSAYGTRKFQEGGQMAPAGAQGAPQDQGAGSLEEMLAQYAQSRDPQLAVKICDMLVQAMQQQAAQQGGAQGAPQGQPMAKSGGKIPVRRGPIFKK